MNEPSTRSGVKSAYRKSRQIVSSSTITTEAGTVVENHTYEPFRAFLRRMGWKSQLKRAR